MHTEPPPLKAMSEWLTPYPSIKSGNRYGHLLLEQEIEDGIDVADALRPYFQSAHADARAYFHAQASMSLHPDAESGGEHACYPDCLPITARRGLFGEVMAGLVTQTYQDQFVGKHAWRVPIFLFRQHADVEKYIYDLARDPTKKRNVFGRFGSDFIGICLSSKAEVVRFIAGEAKWRLSLADSDVEELMHGKWLKKVEGQPRKRSGKGIWFEVNRDTTVPHGVRQLQRLLQDRDPEGHSAAIASLDRALLLQNPVPIPRTNLIVIVGNGSATRDPQSSLIEWTNLPSEYTAPHDLQVVEVILKDGELLIDAIYDPLWPNGS